MYNPGVRPLRHVGAGYRCCRGWNGHRGGWIGTLGHPIMPQIWGPMVCSVQPLMGSFPGSPLIQDTFSKIFGVLKHTPPGPSGAECCTWPLFSSFVCGGICTWLGGTGMSWHLSRHPVTSGLPARGLSHPLCLSFPPVCAVEALQIAMSQLLAGTRGVCGGPGHGSVPVTVFYPHPWQDGADFFFFLIRNALWWEFQLPRSPPPICGCPAPCRSVGTG